MLQQHQTVTVKMISDSLHASDMIVRRDLAEMAEEGLVYARTAELSFPAAHEEARFFAYAPMRKRNPDPSSRSAPQLGPPPKSSNLEMPYSSEEAPRSSSCAITCPKQIFASSPTACRSSTCSPTTPHIDLFLVSGTLRQGTHVFTTHYGSRAFHGLSTNKAFVSATGVFGNEVFGSHPDASVLLGDAVSRSADAYLVLDEDKVGVRDFRSFTTLDRITAAFPNPGSNTEAIKSIETYTTVIAE